jgi:hypothetical protein
MCLLHNNGVYRDTQAPYFLPRSRINDSNPVRRPAPSNIYSWAEYIESIKGGRTIEYYKIFSPANRQCNSIGIYYNLKELRLDVYAMAAAAAAAAGVDIITSIRFRPILM